MVYRVIGLMSGSSLDGMDIAYVEFLEIAGKWTFEIKNTHCSQYPPELRTRLKEAVHLDALSYQLLHAGYGHYIGREVNDFIERNNLHHQVHLVVSHGHTTFHLPAQGMTAQLGDGAAIAAETKLPVVTDLRALDTALGGQGAPIVPIGENLLFGDFTLFLNIGGITNISYRNIESGKMIAFDVCAANRVLNMLAEEKQLSFDENGKIAASGKVHTGLLQKLNELIYYDQPYPKSLANDFGTATVYPLIKSFLLSIEDSLCTYVEHIAKQIENAVSKCRVQAQDEKILVTGGGANNLFLMERLTEVLSAISVTVTVPEKDIVNFKEALIMALAGTLRWREEYTVLNTVTGASRNSIGGALWLGTEA